MATKKSRTKAAVQKPKLAPPVTVDANQRYSIYESCATLRVCRAQIYRDIRNGMLRTIREGKRQFVPGSELIRRSTLPATN